MRNRMHAESGHSCLEQGLRPSVRAPSATAAATMHPMSPIATAACSRLTASRSHTLADNHGS